MNNLNDKLLAKRLSKSNLHQIESKINEIRNRGDEKRADKINNLIWDMYIPKLFSTEDEVCLR